MFTRMQKRIRWGIAATLIGSMVLAGCSSGGTDSGSSPAPSGPAAKKDPVTLKMQIAEGLIVNRDTVVGMVNEFRKVHPEINVEVETLPADQRNAKLQTMITTAEMPDIYQLNALNELTLLANRAGFLYDLGQLESAKNFSEDVRKGVTVDGKMSVFPTGLGFVGFAYNIPMFESVGYSKPPATWEELMDAGEKLKAKNQALMVYAGKWATAIGNVFHWTFGNQANKDAAFKEAYLGNKVDWVKNRSLLLEGYDRFNKLNKYVLTGSFTYSIEQGIQAFAKGQAAMVMGGTWSAAQIDQQNPGFKWGFMNLPYTADKDNSYIYTIEDGFAMNAKSKHLEETKTFMNWFFSKENFAKIIKAKQNMSAMPGVGEVLPVFAETTNWLKSGRVNTFANLGPMTNPVFIKLSETAQGVTFGSDVNKMADEWIKEYNDKIKK
ncbi:ABC transporter substrate-binding protein [Paenibacillus koleovorans]|uniref:ABC transporter substrate-binding protein n=1 Tax=Paenibacillus koleovorans TaxID=121608 RepID=UPI0013E37734|nr:extracellular solute-binding protein [Paenibacillus koleovorans]